MPAVRSSLVVVAVAAAAVAAYFAWFRSGPAPDVAPPAPREQSKPATEPPKPVAPVVALLQTPQAAGAPEADCISYPDGTRLPPLNGVKKAPQILFHRAMPFTKVLRKETDPRTGLEWYVHENGARSTTRMMWRNGVQEAVGEVEMPAETKPL